MRCLAILSIAITVCSCASLLAPKKDGLGGGNFLNKPVEKPRIQDGSSGEIEKISDVKTVDPAPHKDAQFDSLIKQIYDKFLTVGGETKKESSSTQHQVRFGPDGKAYPKMKHVPAKYKKDISATQFGVDGKARPVDSRIPLVHHDEREVSMDDVLNSVKILVDKLTAKRDEEKKQEQQKKEFTFESVHKENDKEETSNDNNVYEEYEALKKKFLDTFDKSHNEKRQTLIGSGKDNHVETGSPQSGLPSKPDHPTLIGSGKDNKREKLRSRLNDLYDELRKETTERLDRERELNEKKRLDFVKKDLVDLLNGLQSKDTFTFHDGKFGFDEKMINSVEETTRENNIARAAKTTKQESKRSKLEVVQSLVKELHELEENKKREVMKKKEEEERTRSVERMEKIFMGVLKKEMEKRKAAAAQEKEAARIEEEKKRAAVQAKLEADALKKRENELNTGRDMLLKIMGDLEKRVANKEKKESASTGKDVKKSTSSDSIEKELDNIISSFSKKIQRKDIHESEIDKAFEGFNIDQNKVKNSRP
ncbi:DNA ligase 1-like [Clytia hemisphaerica]|uniref:Uncharacterized protein n=1 Tax=Clytia hemisphaerica TaxID=252671 RepID=A0A7M5XGI4_9CNID